MKDVFVERNKLVAISCAQGKKENGKESIETYGVLAIFDKYYHK